MPVNFNSARGNTTKARRTKGDESEPAEDGEEGAHPTDTAHDSEIDLSEESASDSEAECDAELEPKSEPSGPDIYNSSAVK